MLGSAVVSANESAVAEQLGLEGLHDPAIPSQPFGVSMPLQAIRTAVKRRTSACSASWS